MKIQIIFHLLLTLSIFKFQVKPTKSNSKNLDFYVCESGFCFFFLFFLIKMEKQNNIDEELCDAIGNVLKLCVLQIQERGLQEKLPLSSDWSFEFSLNDKDKFIGKVKVMISKIKNDTD